MQRKKQFWRSILLVYILSILLSTSPILGIKNVNGTEIDDKGCRDDTYYNATVIITSKVYCVKTHSENKIVLYECRFTTSLIGLFYISDKNGLQEYSTRGGYPNSIVTIYGLEGFFMQWGWYVILFGECDKINIVVGR